MERLRTDFPLRETERLLWRLITAPEGVEKALRERRGLSLPICGDDRLSNAQRLDIYANMYFYRIRDSLKEDFAAGHRVLGGTAFHNLVTDYLLECPPTHWSLRYAGARLPRFLSSHPASKKRPYLPDLARLEWELLDSFDAADAPVLTAEDLQAVPAGEWGRIPLKLVSSARLVAFRFPVDQLRESLLKEAVPGPVPACPMRLLFWRRDLRVFTRRVEGVEARLLRRALQGVPFGQVCEVLARRAPREKSVSEAASLLQRWVGDRILSNTLV